MLNLLQELKFQQVLERLNDAYLFADLLQFQWTWRDGKKITAAITI